MELYQDKYGTVWEEEQINNLTIIEIEELQLHSIEPIEHS